MMRLYWVEQSGKAHCDDEKDENILNCAKVVYALMSPIVISIWQAGPHPTFDLPFKWDWPGGDDDS